MNENARKIISQAKFVISEKLTTENDDTIRSSAPKKRDVA